jgi:hypothetical protein
MAKHCNDGGQGRYMEIINGEKNGIKAVICLTLVTILTLHRLNGNIMSISPEADPLANINENRNFLT